MNVSEVVANLTAAQATLQTLTVLQLTDWWWPTQACVENGDSFDVIIVGAGSAGCVLANRLSEIEGLRVLLVEAGVGPPVEVMLPGLSYYVPNSRLDWNYTSESDPFSSPTHQHFQQKMIRGKMLGGSSSANFFAYVRGSPHDYNTWAEIIKDQSWNFTNVLPYFIKLERFDVPEILNSEYGKFHGTKGPIGVTAGPKPGTDKYLEAFKELGHDVKIDISGDDPLGFTIGFFTIADGVRQSTANSYLAPVKDRPNLHVLRDALVTEVIFEGKRAVGIKIVTKGKEITVQARKEVILSAGVFNSPQILMLSGIGPKDHLGDLKIDIKADLPVGHNFQDHAPVMVYYKMERSNATKKPRNPHEFGSATVVGYTTSDKNQRYPDSQTFLHVTEHDSTGPIEYCSFIVGFKDEICQVLADIEHRNIMSALVTNLHPISRGRVYLRSRNPKDHPVIEAGYYSHVEDLENQARQLKEFVKISNTTYFKEVKAELVDFELEDCAVFKDLDYWMCYARHLRISQWHYCGTCALGTVVDSRLNVLGIENLRVVDASIFPTIPGGNINVPVIMVAEKAADMIKEDLGLKP